ncbi:MAG: alpha/beta hydrolase family protein [Candidatus Aquicultorales bacterium]
MNSFRFVNGIGYKLAADVYEPPYRPPWPVVVFCHGFDSSKRSPRSVPVAEALAVRGIASFLFDFTGHGESEGVKGESTTERQLGDLMSALSVIRFSPELDEDRIALHGSSSGCLAALFAALDRPDLAALALRAPRTDGAFPELYERAPQISIPTLIVQGEFDPLIGVSTEFFERLRGKKVFEIIPKADHLFTDPKHFEEVLQLTVQWLSDQLLEEQAEAA